MVHETGNGAEQFNCPASPNDVNKQLLADCSAGECSTLPPCYPVTYPVHVFTTATPVADTQTTHLTL